jgi:hypothetical protein
VRGQQELSIVSKMERVRSTKIGKTRPSNGSVDRLIDVVVNGPSYQLWILLICLFSNAMSLISLMIFLNYSSV